MNYEEPTWSDGEEYAKPLPESLRERLADSLIPALWGATILSVLLLAPLTYVVICCLSGPPDFGTIATVWTFIAWGLLLWMSCTQK